VLSSAPTLMSGKKPVISETFGGDAQPALVLEEFYEFLIYETATVNGEANGQVLGISAEYVQYQVEHIGGASNTQVLPISTENVEYETLTQNGAVNFIVTEELFLPEDPDPWFDSLFDSYPVVEANGLSFSAVGVPPIASDTDIISGAGALSFSAGALHCTIDASSFALNFEITVRIRPSNLTNPQVIFALKSTAASSSASELTLTLNTNGSLTFRLESSSTAATHYDLTTPSGKVTANQWAYVSVRLRTTTLSILINDVEEATTFNLLGVRQPAFTELFVGGFNQTGDERYFQGLIADILIWANAASRSPLEATAISAAIANAGSTIAFLPLVRYVRTLKRNGIWQKGILLYGLRGSNAAAQSLNWMNLSSNTASFIGGAPLHSARGLRFGGAYGRTFWNATAGNFALSFFSKDGDIRAGTIDTGPAAPRFYGGLTPTVAFVAVNTTPELYAAGSTPAMHLITQRTNPSTLDVWLEGVQETIAEPQAAASSELLLGALRLGGSPAFFQDGAAMAQHFGLWQALTPAQARVLHKAETIFQETTGRLLNRPTTKNTLTYTASAGQPSYSYFTGSPPELHDGSITNGPIKQGGGTFGEFWVLITFAEPTWINEYAVHVGQFNGPFNMPNTLHVYGGTDTSTLLQTSSLNTSGTATPSNPLTTIDVLTNSAFDEPRVNYLFRFVSGGTFVSVTELILRG
jgi:hypothetical protein